MCSPLPFDPLSFSRNQRQFRPTSCFHTSLGKSQTRNSQSKPAENLEACQCLPRNDPWLFHVNVWQKPLQYCKVISLQLIKINGKKKKKGKKKKWSALLLEGSFSCFRLSTPRQRGSWPFSYHQGAILIPLTVFWEKAFSNLRFHKLLQKIFCSSPPNTNLQMCDITQHTAESTLIYPVSPLNNQTELELAREQSTPWEKLQRFCHCIT